MSQRKYLQWRWLQARRELWPNGQTCISPRSRAYFAEITDGVHYAGEPVITEKQGRPCVALVSLSDFDILERLGRGKVTGDSAA